MKRRRGHCSLCQCPAVIEKCGLRVCAYHYRYGEEDPPCPICSAMEHPLWTYTVDGEQPLRKIERRQVKLTNTVFLDDSSEMVLDVEVVTEPAPKDWPAKKRFSVVMIGVGQQVGSHFYITQWASDWEKELFAAVRPTLALASRIYSDASGNFDTQVLAGRWISGPSVQWTDVPMWPWLDVRSKTLNVRSYLRDQNIGSQVNRVGDIFGRAVRRAWTNKAQREAVWKHNYLDVLELSKRVFQIEWPT